MADDQPSTRRCSRCEEHKPLHDFSPRAGRPGKVMSACKKCASKAMVDAYWRRKGVDRPEPDPPGVKRCRRCDAVKPLDEFPPAKRMKLGRHSHCRACCNATAQDWRERNRDHTREYARDWREANPERARENDRRRAERLRADAATARAGRAPPPPPVEKHCAACDRTLPASAFHTARPTTKALAWCCKECAREKARAWYRDNRERGRATRRRYYAENIAATRASQCAWRLANADKVAVLRRAWAKANPDRKRETDRNWQLANPEKVRLYRIVSEGRRRAAMDDGRVPSAVILEIGRRQRWRCAICAHGIRRNHTVDHITPLSRGGRHIGKNLQLNCGPCNSRKHAKDPIDFMRERGLLL